MNLLVYWMASHFLQEGSQVNSSLAALQAKRDVLLRSVRDKDTELSSLRLQVQQQHSSLDLERDRINRELEALRAQLQQQVLNDRRETSPQTSHTHTQLLWWCQQDIVLIFLHVYCACFPQLAINAEQKLEIERLRRELDSTRAELARANSALQSKEMVRMVYGNFTSLFERTCELLMKRCMFCSPEWYPPERYSSRAAGGEGVAAALSEGAGGWTELPQTAGSAPPELPGAGEAEEPHGAGKPSRPVTAEGAVSCLEPRGEAVLYFVVVTDEFLYVWQQACREGELAHKLQEEQFCLLQCAVVEAEGIILDAVAKLDDPVHIRCISTPGKKPVFPH